jgi:hypothetical protein
MPERGVVLTALLSALKRSSSRTDKMSLAGRYGVTHLVNCSRGLSVRVHQSDG